jgi:acyl transferase domain-containing protein
MLINWQAHGTGTEVGDPMEVEAISRVFWKQDGQATFISGLKPTLGHSEGASGISGVLKAMLLLEHGVIPATIGIKR